MSRGSDWCAYDDVAVEAAHDADPEPPERPAPSEYMDEPAWLPVDEQALQRAREVFERMQGGDE